MFDEGVKYLAEGNLKKAEKTFKKVIAASPDHYASYFNLSLLYFQKNDLDSSLKYLKRTSELNPFDMRANKLLSSAYILQENYTESKKIVSSITGKNQTDIDSHKKLGIIYLRENNIRAALGKFTLTRNLSPSDINGNLLFAASCALNNDFEKALDKIKNLKNQLTDNASLAFYAYLLEKNGSTESAEALYKETNTYSKDTIVENLIATLEKDVIESEMRGISHIKEYKNPEISRRMADKLRKETLPTAQASSKSFKARPFNLKATLTETWETYARTPKTSSPINGLNVTSNLKVEGKTKDGTNFSGEWEGFFNRWDNNKLDYYKINATKHNDYEVDIGKFSAKHFPSLVSFPTILEGTRVWKKITPSKFEPTQVAQIAEDPESPLNLGEVYRNNYVDNRGFRDIETTFVVGRTQERKNVGNRREENENTYESSGQFEQWTQSYRVHSQLNKVFDIGASVSLTQDKSRKTIVTSGTNPIESIAIGFDGGIDLLDSDLTIDAEIAYGNYDEDTLELVSKHLRDFAWILKSKYKVMDTISLNYEQKAIGRNFKVEGASQTQDKTSHTINLIYKPKSPKVWFPSSHTIKFKPEIVSPDGGGTSKARYTTVQSVTDFKLPQDSKFTFDYKYYREIDKCDCTNYLTTTIKSRLEYNLKSIQTKIKPSYTFERKDDMVASSTDEKKKEYVFNIENKSIKNLELDYSFEREKKKYNGATTKSYRQYINSFEAKYTFIPSRLDASIKASNDLKNPSDTNKTDISTLTFELNYTSKNGDDRFNIKYEKKDNIYLPWSDSSAYYQQYMKFKYTKKF
ncbi:MAG: hypothetical protein KAR32_00620 [Candidatus Omnitrophica bacterium]|nr:hypothetical protein [Candidatus Omnitrophota bacterium]